MSPPRVAIDGWASTAVPPLPCLVSCARRIDNTGAGNLEPRVLPMTANQGRTQQPLSGLTVVELARSVAGAYCGRLLGDLGAEVFTLASPPSPLSSGAGEGEDVDTALGGFFLYLHAGKRRLGLALGSAAGKQELEHALAQADLLIEDLNEEERQRLDLVPESLCSRYPRLIVVSVTPFGRSGRYRDWKTSEIVDWAMGGYMYFGGDPDRGPLMVPGQQAAYHGGIQAAVAALGALYERDQEFVPPVTVNRGTGAEAGNRFSPLDSQAAVGQAIDVSVQEAMLSAHAWLSVMWSHEGKIQERENTDLVCCADGWIHFHAPALHDDLFLLIGRPDLLEARPPLTAPAERLAFNAVLMPAIAAWAATLTKQEIYVAAQEMRIPVAPVNTIPDLLDHPQLWSREFFRRIEKPDGGTLTFPGMPYRLTEAAGKRQTGVGTEGAANPHEARTAGLGPVPYSPPATRFPLHGIRVLEMTANWAGPLAGRHLADLGAEVIKVEWPRRPATRAAHYAGGQGWTRPYNRAGYFNNLNRNKLGVTLDLSLPAGRQVFLRLVQASDVLVENNSARVMGNLGLDYATLAAENPRLVMLSISGYGASGPFRDHVAYGSNIEAACGLASLMGYSPTEPRRTSSYYADPVAAGHGAVAVLAALRASRQSGRGMHIDVSLLESALCLFGEAFAEFGATGVAPSPRGNRSRTIAPQGCYPCVGQDCWLAIATPDEADWRGLCHVLGRDDWLERGDLTSAAGRRGAHDELDAGIAAWAREHDHYEAARRLQAAGVPAAPVMINWELLSDPHLYERGFYISIEHPDAGVFPYPGLPWRFSRTPGAIRLPAPRFGEHNQLILREIAGLSDEEVRRLREEGVVADAPMLGLPWTRASRAR